MHLGYRSQQPKIVVSHVIGNVSRVGEPFRDENPLVFVGFMLDLFPSFEIDIMKMFNDMSLPASSYGMIYSTAMIINMWALDNTLLRCMMVCSKSKLLNKTFVSKQGPCTIDKLDWRINVWLINDRTEIDVSIL